jgi:molecular chaperone GrpE
MDRKKPERENGEAEGESREEAPSMDPGAESGTSSGRAPAEAGVTDQSQLLSDEIQEELAELERLRERHLRLAAEYDNYRKRTRRELAEAGERARGDLVARLLDGLDDLERVLATPAEATTVEALHEGVELVQRKLQKELTDIGLERIAAEGAPFDPRLHDALLTIPVDDPEQDEVVSRVLVNGYRLGERVLRPARVEVMKYRPADPRSAEEGLSEPAEDGSA